MTQTDTQTKGTKLPPDRIVVTGGKIIHLAEWTLWNLSPVETITINFDQESGEYTVNVCDPEHGGRPPQKGKTIEEATKGMFHPTIAEKFNKLFNLDPPEEATIRAMHYRKDDGLQVVFQ